MHSKLSLVATLCLAVLSQPASSEQQKDFQPSVNKNGQQMVYYSYRDNEYPDLFVLDMNSSVENNLTQTSELWEIEPLYSPDGKTIWSQSLSVYRYCLFFKTRKIQINKNKKQYG